MKQGIAFGIGVLLFAILVYGLAIADDLVVENAAGRSMQYDVDWGNRHYVSIWDGECEGSLDPDASTRCERVESGYAKHVPVEVEPDYLIVYWDWAGSSLDLQCSADVGRIVIEGSDARCL